MSVAQKQPGKKPAINVDQLTLPAFPREVPERERFIEMYEETFEEVLEPKLRHIETLNLRRNGKDYSGKQFKYKDELHAKIYHSETFDMFLYVRETTQLFCLSGEILMQTANLVNILRAEQDLLIIGDQSE